MYSGARNSYTSKDNNLVDIGGGGGNDNVKSNELSPKFKETPFKIHFVCIHIIDFSANLSDLVSFC